jgi:hypothetical protein
MSRMNRAKLRDTGAVIFTAIAGVNGCGDDNGTGPAPNFSGTYEGTQTNQPTTCSPQNLPAPTSQDPSQYFQPGGLETFDLVLIIRHEGSALTVSPEQDEQGQPLHEFDFTGSIAADGSHTVTRSLDIGLEGPREGGHQFYLEQQDEASGIFVQSGGELRNEAEGTFNVIFHEGDRTGPVFTTCSTSFVATTVRTGG